MSATSDSFPATAGSAQPRDFGPIFLGGGILALAAAIALMILVPNEADPARAFVGYLIGASFWFSLLCGFLFLTTIWYLFDAGWPIIVRRQFEHALGAMPWMGLVFLPLLLVAVLMPESGKAALMWLNEAAISPSGHGNVAGDVLFLAKEPYLNALRFIIGFVFVFGTLSVCAGLFRRYSFAMDETGDAKYYAYGRRLAGLAIFLISVAVTIFAIDFYKSMNYHWFSTMYGVWFFAACVRSGLAAGILILFYQATKENGLKGIVNGTHFYYMGCLLLAFTVFWAYISFSQFFLIYSANIPEETFWYLIREVGPDGSKSSWWIVSRGLIFLYFFVPFLWLIWYTNKKGWRLALAAIWILFFHFVDLVWNIMPQKIGTTDPAFSAGYQVRPLTLGLTEILAFIGVGGICIWAFLRSANKHRPVPIRDPRVEESLKLHE